MHSTTIFLLALGLLATVAMARPGGKPRPGHHHGGSENEISQGHHGHGSSTYRVPDYIRLPRTLTAKLGHPRATFTAKKILDGKYLLISPALIFELKDIDTESSTTARPATTTEETSIEDTTTAPIDEESTTTEPELEESTTTEEIDEESTTTEPEEEESTTPTPLFFKKRSFEINNNEQLLFLED